MNLGSVLRHSAARSPRKAAVICADQIVSYEALDRSTDTLARWLLREGLETGDRGDDTGATAAAFDHGWLRTGDLVRRDADGFFWFEGRAKQIIIRGGSNISPQEVEEALYHHPAVLEETDCQKV